MLPEDYYAILGVSPNASALTIRKAYRRLVLKYHPDRNPGDPNAEEQFKKVVAAYQVISDKNRKAQYDQKTAQSQRSKPRPDPFTARPRQNKQADFRKSGHARHRKSDVVFRERNNELESSDALNGILLGSMFGIIAGTWSVQRNHAFTLNFVLWTASPFATVPLGNYIGKKLRRGFERAVDRERIPQILEPVGRLLPLLLPVLTALQFARLGEYRGVDLSTNAIVPAACGAAISAALGSAFGRAFTSVGKRIAAKIFGVFVGGLMGLISGLVLGLGFSLFGASPRLDPGFFEFCFSSGVAGAIAGALASVRGSIRSLR